MFKAKNRFADAVVMGDEAIMVSMGFFNAQKPTFDRPKPLKTDRNRSVA
jgi:hypothetical protein